MSEESSARSEESLEKLVTTYKALADETRLRILGLVAERPYNGRQLSEALGASQSIVSHHIEKLRRAGLIKEMREGRERVYGLERATLIELAREQLSQSRTEEETDADPVLKNFFDGEKLRSLPVQRKKKMVVLKELLKRFEPGVAYPEKQLNEMLSLAHEDYATLRRELVMAGLMDRERGVYHVAAVEPASAENASS